MTKQNKDTLEFKVGSSWKMRDIYIDPKHKFIFEPKWWRNPIAWLQWKRQKWVIRSLRMSMDEIAGKHETK